MTLNSAITNTNAGATRTSVKTNDSQEARALAAQRPAGERGTTYIEDEVISVIARMAAEQVEGIHRIGESNLRNLLSRLGNHHGVGAEVGLKQAAVDVEISVEFGYSITDIAKQMRERIVESVESMTGRKVVEVNIFVVEVHVPKADTRRRRSLE